VGVILTQGVAFYSEMHEALVKKVSKKRGDVKFLVQRPYPDPISWNNAIRKLQAAEVSAVVTYGGAPTYAAAKERLKVPVVFAGLYKPAAAGIKAANFGGAQSDIQVTSVVPYIKELNNASVIGVIYNSWEEDSARQFADLRDYLLRNGYKVQGFNLQRPGDISVILAGSRVDALVVTSSATAASAYQTLLNIAGSLKIPVASLLFDGQKAAVITYSADPEEQGEMAAGILLDSLRSSRPARADSKKAILTYNFKRGSELGLRVSFGLVMNATEVIY
jgi:ABC-type uncharacterized transport system substrate-binding protein